MRSLEKSLLSADRLSASVVVGKDISKRIVLPQLNKDKDEVDGETNNNNQEPGEEADNQLEVLEEELVEENHQTAKEGEGKSIL